MKKVKVETTINVDEIRQRVLKKYQNDQFFKDNYQTIKKNNDNLDLVDVIEVIESKRICSECDGLDECKQAVKGHSLSLEDNVVRYQACHYLIRVNELEYKYKNLVYTTFQINKELADATEMDITKQRLDIAKYFKLLQDNQTEKGMFLTGPTGVGKTFIIEALLDSYLSKNVKCAYLLLNDFFNEMKSLYFSYDSDDKILFNRIIQRLKKVQVLVIDDIGSEKVDAISRDDILFPLLDYRMKNKKMTHFTSNYSLEVLEQHYTETSTKSSEPIKAKRLLERIRVLSKVFTLNEEKSRR